MPYYTEEQIERAVELWTDALDRRLMSGELTQAQYDAEMDTIIVWSDRAYRDLSAGALPS